MDLRSGSNFTMLYPSCHLSLRQTASPSDTSPAQLLLAGMRAQVPPSVPCWSSLWPCCSSHRHLSVASAWWPHLHSSSPSGSSQGSHKGHQKHQGWGWLSGGALPGEHAGLGFSPSIAGMHNSLPFSLPCLHTLSLQPSVKTVLVKER